LKKFATRIQTYVYDVILADDHLPGWTGTEAAAEGGTTGAGREPDC
jgi:hypothetical protein